MKHPAFGHANGAGTQVQFLRNRLRRLAFHDHAPKGSPGALLKLGLDQLERLAEKMIVGFVLF